MLTVLLMAGFPFWSSLYVAAGFYALLWLAFSAE